MLKSASNIQFTYTGSLEERIDEVKDYKWETLDTLFAALIKTAEMPSWICRKDLYKAR